MTNDQHQCDAGQGRSANLAELLDTMAARGSRPAISDPRREPADTTYTELANRAWAWSATLAMRGLEPGDRVALLRSPDPEWPAVFFGVLAAGGVVVPVAPDVPLGELEAQLDIVDVRFIIGCPLSMNKAVRLSQRFGCPAPLLGADDTASMAYAQTTGCQTRDGADPAVIAFTSGSTGTPKGAVVTHDNLRFELEAFAQVFPQAPRRTISVLPWHHLYGLVADLLACLARGTHITICASRDPQSIARVLTACRPDCMIVVPVVLEALRRRIERETASIPGFAVLVQHTRRLPRSFVRALLTPLHRRFGGRLTTFICGGAPLDTTTSSYLRGLGLRVCQGYGQTEASPCISFEPPGEANGMSVGKPLPGVEIKLEDGEILTRGRHVMTRYYADEEATRLAIDPDGWLHTGDLGALDSEGRLHVRGRRANLIVLACGENVVCEEVEAALAACRRLPSFANDYAATSISTDRSGEEVVVAAVPTDELRHFDIREQQRQLTVAIADATRHLASYKQPTRVVAIPGPLPRTSTTKVRRAELRTAVLDAMRFSHAQATEISA